MSYRPLLLIEIETRKMQKLEILLPCRAEYSITVPIFQSLGVLIFWEHENRITSWFWPIQYLQVWRTTPPPASTKSHHIFRKREKSYKLSPDSSSGPWNSLRTFIGLLARFWLPRLTCTCWLTRIPNIFANSVRNSVFSTLALTSSGASLLTRGFFSGAFIFHTTRGGVSCCT